MRGKRLWASLLALCFYAFLPSCYVGAEQMYSISETELTTLENNLEMLSQHNKERQEALDAQEKELRGLKKELEESEKANTETRASLEKANQSLKQLEEEAKAKISKAKRERNAMIVLSGILLYAAAK